MLNLLKKMINKNKNINKNIIENKKEVEEDVECKYEYRDEDFEHFENSKKNVVKFNNLYPEVNINIKDIENIEDIKNSLDIYDEIDKKNNSQIEEGMILRQSTVFEEYEDYNNLFNKKDNVDITNQMFSMNRTDSMFRVEDYSTEKEIAEMMYDLNNEYNTYTNTDAERGYENGYDSCDIEDTTSIYWDDTYNNNNIYDVNDSNDYWDNEIYNPNSDDDYLGNSGIYNPWD